MENELTKIKEQTIKELMKKHAETAEMLYETSIKLGLQNDQDFMDWQDRLNKVTFVHKEDLK